MKFAQVLIHRIRYTEIQIFNRKLSKACLLTQKMLAQFSMNRKAHLLTQKRLAQFSMNQNLHKLPFHRI